MRTKVVVSAQSLEDARGEEAHPKLDQLHTAIRSEWGRLQYEGISSQQGGANLPTCEEDRIVPGNNANNYTERRIFCGDLAFRRVLEYLLRKK